MAAVDEEQARYAETVAYAALVLATVRDCHAHLDDEALAGQARELVDEIRGKLAG